MMAVKQRKDGAERARRARRKVNLLDDARGKLRSLEELTLGHQVSMEIEGLKVELFRSSNALKIERIEEILKRLDQILSIYRSAKSLKSTSKKSDDDRLESPVIKEDPSDQSLEKIAKVLDKRHYQWMRRMKETLGIAVIRHDDAEHFLRDNCKTYLSEIDNPVTGKYFLLAVRKFDEQRLSYERRYESKSRALADIKDMVQGLLEFSTWIGVDQWFDRAKDLVELKISDPKAQVGAQPQSLSFILALQEYSECRQFLNDNVPLPKALKRHRGTRRTLLRNIGDIALPAEVEFFDNWKEQVYLKIAASIKSEDPSRNTFRVKAWTILEALSFASTPAYIKVFPGVVGCGPAFKLGYLDYDYQAKPLKKFAEHRDILVPAHVKRLLLIARHGYNAKYDRCGAAMFNNLVMQYATGLRVGELRRLSNNPADYFIEQDGTLNIQGKYHPMFPLRPGLSQLIKKTEDTVDWSIIGNPIFPLVARLIVKHDRATFAFTQKDFFKPTVGGWREINIPIKYMEFGREKERKTRPFAKITEACARNTLATALSDLGIHPQEYLGHTTKITADLHYTRRIYRAKNVDPLLHYSFITDPDGNDVPNTGVWLSDNGSLFNIAKYCNLWHAFLLGSYVLQKFADCGTDEREKGRLERLFVEEAKRYHALFEKGQRTEPRPPVGLRDIKRS